LTGDGRFSYQGGSLPLPPAEALRVRQLARRVVAALPPFRGYLGIDVIVGSSSDGSLDHVIEINPRLTTSYVGVRAAAQQNLAAVMLALASGGRPKLTYRSDAIAEGISFDSAGNVSVGANELARA
jgi:predicted ATP-grasp superfamily ATP-dependent carboligase